MREDYYQNKSIHYGIGHTRLRRILGLVGDSGGLRVLDVGCASGYLGKLIKDRGNNVDGVEISAAAAEEARKKLDYVYVLDVEKEWPDALRKNDYDLLVCTEVLEHVFDPSKVLASARGALKVGGHIIISTPNFMTWTHRVKFLFGKFAYTDQGMLDFGHIRFFTYAYLKKILAENYLEIEDERHIIFPGKLTKILKLWPSLFAGQFVLKVKKNK
ncbi:MAG: class I SAM-dependent methyltransferase [Candidatus Pacebacteria bacterium]|nr:class I SAM-dependent methyltransferase [Candidatus Paceibacterota bacterium]